MSGAQRLQHSHHGAKRFQNFKCDIIDGPNFTCHSCSRCLFKTSVKRFTPELFTNFLSKHKVQDSFLKEIGLECTSDNTFCHNCLKSIKSSEVPNINVTNGLQLECIPEELMLSDLEQQLIARTLLFLKIKRLPKGFMKANVDMVINVPIECDDITNSMQKLPRHPNDAKIVAVELKRRLKYQNSYLNKYINPKACIDAIKILKKVRQPTLSRCRH